MADISLRAYMKEIDELIERDQLDQAISHARHILQNYPKHLDTYRLLGKAYLEAKRYGDAADIFQRVLSAVPDDFVSHIGMAIVREDEGNIDSAIWHMERAFETNPANPAIRQELSRLIGRRDGIEPHKIRLTRGALARQYAQGELYPQAIAELRSALQEDPDRPELEVILAKMYWQSGQTKEASSISKQILEKLPFSYDANRIMAALYESEGRTDKAGEHHRRLAALEPYAAFSDSSSIDPASVDMNAVRIDQLEWIPGQPLPGDEPGQPDWVASLGVDLTTDEVEIPETDESPPWLTEIERAAPSSGAEELPAMQEETMLSPTEEAASTDAIPDWMQEAGWGPSTGESQETPVSFSDAEIDALEAGVMPNDIPDVPEDDGELAPAEIPNWLRDKAPVQPDDEGTEAAESAETPAASEGAMPDWLSEIADEAEDVRPDPAAQVETTAATEAPSPAASTANADAPEVPSWIDDTSPGATSTIITWLGDRPEAETPETAEPDAEPAPEPEATAEPASEQAEDGLSWLDDAAEEEPTPEVAVDPTPSWLAGVAEAASQQSSSPEETPAAEEMETPADAPEDDWLANLRAADAQAAEPADEEPEPLIEDGMDAPDWLEGVAEPESSVEEADGAGAPDWLRGVEEPEEITPATPSPTPAAEAPDWLKSGDELQPEPGAVRADVPDWLQGIADQGPAGPTPAPEASFEEPAPEGDAPSWLKDFAGEEEVGAQPAEMDPQAIQQIEAELSAATEPAEPVEAPGPEAIGVEDELDDEEVFRWLESLADRPEGEVAPAQPAGPAGQSGQAEPALRQDAPPEDPDESMQWLEDLAAQRGIDVDVMPEVATPTPATPEPAPPPDETRPAPAAEPIAADESSPDWLKEMATGPADETMVSIPRPPVAEAPAHPIDPVEPEVERAPAADPIPPQALADVEPDIPAWLDEAATVAAEVPAEPVPEPVQTPEQPPVVAPAPATPEAVEPVEPVVSEVPTPEPQVEEAAAPAAEVVPEKPKKYKEPPTEAEIILQGARQALAAGDAGRALSDYKKMISRKQDLDTVIEDLEEALDRYPNLPTMWQALGDAYMKADRLAEAIQAYQRGMEVA